MPRTALTVVSSPGKYPGNIAANAADFSFAAGDAVNGNKFSADGSEIILVQNGSGTTAYTVTVKSVSDPYKRTGDIGAYTVGANEFAVLGPVPVEGYRQSDGNVYIDVNNANIKLAIIRPG